MAHMTEVRVVRAVEAKQTTHRACPIGRFTSLVEEWELLTVQTACLAWARRRKMQLKIIIISVTTMLMPKDRLPETPGPLTTPTMPETNEKLPFRGKASELAETTEVRLWVRNTADRAVTNGRTPNLLTKALVSRLNIVLTSSTTTTIRKVGMLVPVSPRLMIVATVMTVLIDKLTLLARTGRATVIVRTTRQVRLTNREETKFS